MERYKITMKSSCDDPSYCHHGPCRMAGACQQPWLRVIEGKYMKQRTWNILFAVAIIMIWLTMLVVVTKMHAATLTVDAFVDAGQEFSISHVTRDVKMRLLECPHPAPKVIPYLRWRNEANTAIFYVPMEAVGCVYDVNGTRLGVIGKP